MTGYQHCHHDASRLSLGLPHLLKVSELEVLLADLSTPHAVVALAISLDEPGTEEGTPCTRNDKLVRQL